MKNPHFLCTIVRILYLENELLCTFLDMDIIVTYFGTTFSHLFPMTYPHGCIWSPISPCRDISIGCLGLNSWPMTNLNAKDVKNSSAFNSSLCCSLLLCSIDAALFPAIFIYHGVYLTLGWPLYSNLPFARLFWFASCLFSLAG